VQDAFVNVIRSIGTFNGSSTLETWLHRIVVNCSLMILRSRRRSRCSRTRTAR
jgi:RNA polymerase sigma-70 factor (ECF subfamily)